jgi:hypothetical protein
VCYGGSPQKRSEEAHETYNEGLLPGAEVRVGYLTSSAPAQGGRTPFLAFVIASFFLLRDKELNLKRARGPQPAVCRMRTA